MGSKLDANKKQKKEALLNTAFDLFTTKGIHKTSISDIVNQAGVAKGTFYLYFSDKFDIRNKLIAHEAGLIFSSAYEAMRKADVTDFEKQIIFIAEYIIDVLEHNPKLLSIISKHLSWGVFKNSISSSSEIDEESPLELFHILLKESGHTFNEPEIMIYAIIELVSGMIYNPILYSQPVPLEDIKPHINRIIIQIIQNHYAD